MASFLAAVKRRPKEDVMDVLARISSTGLFFDLTFMLSIMA